jgi:hypothetical protein
VKQRPEKLIFSENLRNQHLHKFNLGVWNETEFSVFWLRRKHSFSFCLDPSHQNSLQCLSLSRKRNQEAVDISHFFFWPFHISMFRRFSIFHRQLQQISLYLLCLSCSIQSPIVQPTNQLVSTEKL